VLNRQGYAQFGLICAVVILVASLTTHRLIPALSPAMTPKSAKDAL
jgi:predicted RND superfamily exporter protein